MNPARSFAPALYNWNWENQWLYYAAPMSGALVATFLFRLVFYKKPEKVDELITNEINDTKGNRGV
jgi:hypothetical protein